MMMETHVHITGLGVRERYARGGSTRRSVVFGADPVWVGKYKRFNATLKTRTSDS